MQEHPCRANRNLLTPALTWRNAAHRCALGVLAALEVKSPWLKTLLSRLVALGLALGILQPDTSATQGRPHGSDECH
jgi:hypothetical protein